MAHLCARNIGLDQAQFQGVQDLLADQNLLAKIAADAALHHSQLYFGFTPYVQYAPRIIRGLFLHRRGFRGVGRGRRVPRHVGGGRYDNLVLSAAIPCQPSVLPSVTWLSAWCSRNSIACPSSWTPLSSPVLVTVFDEDSLPSFQLAAQLRQAGRKWHSIPKQPSWVNNSNTEIAWRCRICGVVLGTDELAQGKAALKNLRSGEQISVDRTAAVAAIHEMLAKQ